MAYLALARKWRPGCFAEVVGQEAILQALGNALGLGRLHHAYLFSGTRGVGKTTIARILAKSLNCEQGVSATPCNQCSHCDSINQGCFVDLLEVDAASRTRVEDTRELLDNVQYAPTKGRYKVYLIDEVHMLSGHSFNALLKTLEEPPEHVIFLLATTDPQKLPITVLSRCLQFHLKALQPTQIQSQLVHILEQEHINFETPALELISEAADGSMRDALSILDQAIAYCGDTITLEKTQNMLGTVDQTRVIQLLNALLQQDNQLLLSAINQYAESGADFTQVLDSLLQHFHQIAMAQSLNTKENKLERFIDGFSAQDIQLFYQICLHGKRDLPLAPNPRLGFEMVCLRLSAFAPKKISQAPKIQTKSKPADASTGASTDNDWASIVKSLSLSGLSQVLAENCVMIAKEQNYLQLQLAPNKATLLGNAQQQRLNEALNLHFGQTIKLEIKTANSEQASPAEIAEKHKKNQYANAESAISADSNVQKILQQFDATIVPDSIHPIPNEE